MASFSVIIPAFNSALSIEAAIKSCLDQSLKPSEIIVIDDCSTDNTVSVVRDIQSGLECETLVRLLSTCVNSGAATARNLGWNISVGDYVAFLDSDDQWHPLKLERIHAILHKNVNIQVLCHCNENSAAQTSLLRISRLSILIRNITITPNLILRNDIKERFDENMRYTEDHDLLLRIANTVPIHQLVGAGIPTVLGRRPMTAGGLSGNRFRMRLGEIYMYKKFLMRNVTAVVYFPLVFIIVLAKLFLEILRAFNK